MITLFAYVDGFDLEGIESVLIERLERFVEEWGIPTARVVNDKPQLHGNLKEGDLPEWNIGLNFTVDRLPREKIQSLVRFLNSLSRETGRDIAIGAGGEDWCAASPDARENLVELLAEQLA